MDLYVVICEDRHCDIVIEIFNCKEVALCYAKYVANLNAKYPEDMDYTIYDKSELFRCTYSCEGDCVYVVKRKLNHLAEKYGYKNLKEK